MFVLASTHRRALNQIDSQDITIRTLRASHRQMQWDLNRALEEFDNLLKLAREKQDQLDRAMRLANEAMESARNAPSQFTDAEIRTLIRLCHPDKHAGSDAATAMTAKLLRLRG